MIEMESDDMDGIRTLQTYIDSCCKDSRSTFSQATSIAAQATCCILQVTGFDIDVITMDVHPRYEYSDTLSEEDNNNNQNNNKDSQDYDPDYTDFSNETFPQPIWNRREDWEIAVKSAAVIPVVFLAVIGNVAVIRIIIKARLYRNPINMFILNMSFADLLCALIFPWILLVSDLYQSFELGEFICKTEGFFLITLMLTSVFSLTTISYDRLKAVIFPFKPRMSRKQAKIFIWFVWIAAMASACPLIIWRSYQEREWENFHEKWCREIKTTTRLYWILLLVLLVWIPLTILTLTYAAILAKLDTLEKRQKDHPSQFKKKSKVVRMLFSVVLLFTICWSPFTAFTYIRMVQRNTDVNPPWLRHMLFVSEYLMFVNSAVNPIIYGLKNDNVKRELRLALPVCLRRAKVSCEISAVHHHHPNNHPNNNNNPNNNRAGAGAARGPMFCSDSSKERHGGIFTSSYDENSPASVVSLQRRSSALEDMGTFVSSNVTKLTIPD